MNPLLIPPTYSHSYHTRGDEFRQTVHNIHRKDPSPQAPDLDHLKERQTVLIQ